jgi:protein-tyrosine kinase
MPNDLSKRTLDDSDHARELSLVERVAERMRPTEPNGATITAFGLPGSGKEAPLHSAETPPPVAAAATVDAGTNQPVTLPIDRLRARGLLTPGNERSKLAEQYRLVKRPLLNKALATNGGDAVTQQLIMVTSARPGEGKTFTAFNLALSIAGERHLQVILVDADPHRGQVLDTLGLDYKPGFMDYLAGRVQRLSELMLPTDRENLWVLPPGRDSGNSTELIAGPRMTPNSPSPIGRAS